jgi:CRP-like cAMP-binding protein
MANFLIDQLSAYESFNEEELALIEKSFMKVPLQKEDYFLREGQISNYIGLVESGLVLYKRTSDVGEEIICDFAKEGEWVTQYHSFASRVKSLLSIQAIEPTILHVVSYENLNSLYAAIPGFERIARQLIEKFFIQMIQRADNLQNLKAEERYEKLLKESPDLLQRVPQYFIASYLGMAPQSLSRIRKK